MSDVPLNTSPGDVHQKLVTNGDHSWTLGLMAYAIVEDQKYEWMKHLENAENRSVSAKEIENWFRHQTPEFFDRIVNEAEHALQLVADDALAEIIEDERRNVLDSAVIATVNERTGGWRQFLVSLLAGFVGAVIFSALILVLAMIVLDNRSLIDVLQQTRNTQVQAEQQQSK